MAGVDLELRKAFQELQTKMITTTQQLKMSDLQIETLKRQITHTKLVEQELQGVTDPTRTYQGVGRMFILQPVTEIRSGLKDKIKTNGDKIKTIETNKSYLERSIKESEDNLREMVMSRQQHK